MSEKFQRDLYRLYDVISENQKKLGDFYGLIEDKNYENEELRTSITEFLDECDLEYNKENILAVLSRLINLRDEQFVQVISKNSENKKDIDKKRAIGYLWTKNFHIKRQEGLLEVINNEKLLNEFYRELLKGIHEIGIALSHWQYEWNEHIINNINPGLKEEFGENVMKYLETHELLDMDEKKNIVDRAYSVLDKQDGNYTIKTYAQFFKEDTNKVSFLLEKLIEKLQSLEENDTNQKENYINYFKALNIAFSETNRYKLVKRWREVDRAWMKITSPLQVGHPLEYYEDHYRKAVALEWDVRLSNPKNIGASSTLNSINFMYKKLFDKIGEGKKQVYARTKENLQRIQLYIGRPAFYYASEFNGLFSAQVVPNDEQVSTEEGKKIFAFADNILDAQRAKPFLKINKIVFGDDFLQKERELIFKKEELWHKVYEVSTIGHEFGHILWLDSDSEITMNKSGVFKNIEEFKATTGGLVAFFMSENEEIKEYVFLELIKRAVGLIAWRKTGEVEPYYCEGLIHLKALFDCGVLEFNEKLIIDTNEEKYEKLKNWYLDTYERLARHYLMKKDANEFLKLFACKDNDDYMPIDDKVKSFVSYYWELHQKIGRDLDDTIKKSDWR
ncbi:MAG: invasion protein CiaB [Epsilonproteobacteria bacterium]|nr:invasion protein CiaB [Campylobacterota bacterium]